MKRFDEFDFREEILRAIRDAGYEECTPIQDAAIEPILEGRDLTGLAETGSGKTAAFLLPILEKLKPGGEDPQALVVAPTRELAMQVANEAEKLASHLEIRIAAVYGGTGLGEQKNRLLDGVDLVVGTPGRIIDFVRQTYLRLSSIRHLVLDEADRMLDMGFIKDIEYIMSKAPLSRQTLLFSATLPPEIMRLANQFMYDPVEVEVERPSLTARNIDQSVVMVDGVPDKTRALIRLIRSERPEQALVFVATREMTTELGEALRRKGIHVASISSLLSQANRERVMASFRDGTHRVLVATDVAARGLDVKGVSHVFNFDVPSQPDDYVHRVGRTGRAGATGRAITLVGSRDRRLLADVESHLKVRIRRENLDGEELPAGADEASGEASPAPRSSRSKGRGRGGGRGGGSRGRSGSGSGSRSGSGTKSGSRSGSGSGSKSRSGSGSGSKSRSGSGSGSKSGSRSGTGSGAGGRRRKKSGGRGGGGPARESA